MSEAPKEVILTIHTATFWATALKAKGGRHRYVRADIADETLAALKDALLVMRQQNILEPVNQETIDITMERMWAAVAKAETADD